MKENILEILNKRIMVCDGAMGTMLQKYGLSAGECSEYWNITNPGKVSKIHEEYIKAGAEIILCNTFGANRLKLRNYKLDDKVKEINMAAVNNVKKVAGEKIYIAGCISSIGHLLEPLGDLKESDAYDTFKEQAGFFVESGCELIVIETMISIEEAIIATKAAKDNSRVPVISSMAFEKGKNGFRTVMGVDIPTMVKELENAGADIIGSNCGKGPEEMLGVIKEIRANTKKFILAEPNAGLPILKNGSVTYDGTPEILASYVLPLVSAGANIIGGCCGTGPEHIAQIKKIIERSKR